jgi:outer membrane protein assembly factor BamB
MPHPSPRILSLALTLCAAVLLQLVAPAQAPQGDWPQWRGPDRTGVSTETGLLKEWPAGGPPLAYKVTDLGEGHATPAITGGRIYGMGLKGQDEVVWSLDAATGAQLWSVRMAAPVGGIGTQGGYGPRGTPTVVGDVLYAEGIGGEVVCMGTADGKIRWQKNLVRDFGGSVPRWGYSESPLVDGEKVIVTPGSRRATMVALNRQTGETIWQATSPQGDSAHYSSPIVAEIAGVRQYIQFVSGGVIGVAAADGKFLWRFNTPANRTANCSTPIARGEHVFAASGYGTGGGLAKITRDGDTWTATEVYFTRQMQNHHGGVVLLRDHVYGFNERILTCLDFLKGGNPAWENPSVGKGSLTVADGHLYCRSEGGQIALVEAKPDGYVEKGRFMQPERRRERAWAHPVVAGGRLFIRDQDLLFCYDVRNPAG